VACRLVLGGILFFSPLLVTIVTGIARLNLGGSVSFAPAAVSTPCAIAGFILLAWAAIWMKHGAQIAAPSGSDSGSVRPTR
jgi:hypothetical protein